MPKANDMPINWDITEKHFIIIAVCFGIKPGKHRKIYGVALIISNILEEDHE